MHLCFASSDDRAVNVYLVMSGGGVGDYFPQADALAKSHGFTGAAGSIVYAHDADGLLAHVLYGIGNGKDALGVAALSAKLPEGVYRIASDGGMAFSHIAAGWADGAYRFDRYKARKTEAPKLFISASEDADAISREAAAIDHLRNLVNTPAQDLGPQDIQADIQALGKTYGAEVSAIVGDELLAQNYPMIHAVGRAGDADYAPRLVHLTWGDPSHPKLALVGKGVSFDSGGLNIKPGSGMRIMKKDMGGAAHVIALAELIMGANLPVHLSLFVPTVENAISGNAFRPGDILKSRKGLTVEIDNTDAEGRLILGDALTRASEDDPDILIDFATLTGAARVALGADLAPVYTDDDALAAQIEAGSAESGDPVWRMPLWAPYRSDLSSPIADIVNSGGGFGGSITAGLFLKEFVTAKRWVHMDVWAWRKGKYTRPEGGAACGLRAVWQMLKTQYQ
ncbi:MAG: leucyl aminopeptidase family protein [Hyphomonas sp.]